MLMSRIPPSATTNVPPRPPWLAGSGPGAGGTSCASLAGRSPTPRNSTACVFPQIISLPAELASGPSGGGHASNRHLSANLRREPPKSAGSIDKDVSKPGLDAAILYEPSRAQTSPVSQVTPQILVVPSLDRLARSTHDLFEITRSLDAQGADFKSLREPWADTTSPMGKFLLTVFSGLSELERNLIKDRTEAGRQSARKRGVKFGRKPILTTHQQSEVAKMLNEGRSIRSIARHFNVGVATIDRIKNTKSTPI